MELILQSRGDETIIRLVGELDMSSCDVLLRACERLLGNGYRGDLVLDLSELTFMDSRGVEAFTTMASSLKDSGALILSSPLGMVAKVLHMVRADTFENVEIRDLSPVEIPDLSAAEADDL